MLRALDEFDIQGIPTTIPAHRLLLENPEFVDGSYSTATVEAGALEGLGPPEPRKPHDRDSEGSPEGVLLVAGTPTRLWHPAIAGWVSAATRTVWPWPKPLAQRTPLASAVKKELSECAN